MSTVDLGARGEYDPWISTDNIPPAPTPKIIILSRAGTFTGACGSVYVKDTDRYQDKNPANPAHYYVTLGTYLLFNVSTNQVIDLRTADSNSLVVVWPK